MMRLQEQPSLSRVFDSSPIVEWGPYKVSKAPWQSWKQANLYVAGKNITVGPSAKQMMALLIAHQGSPVTSEAVTQEIRERGYMPQSQKKGDTQTRLVTRIKVHICRLRSAFKKADMQPYAEAIEAAEKAGSYLLRIPTQKFQG